MLRQTLLNTLKTELKTGLTKAILAEAERKNPDRSVTLASLQGQADHIRAHIKDAQESLDSALEAYRQLIAKLEKGSEISPAFISDAVSRYVDTSM